MYNITPFEYLDSLNVNYSLIPHTTTYTAQETAESAHIKGKELAKVIVVGSGNIMSMVVVPANSLLLQSDLARMLKTPDLTIVPEHLFFERFPACDVGAMPPFGKLYGMDVFLAKDLAEQENIIFNGGTHNILIKMKTSDFIDITQARVITFGYRTCNTMSSRVKHPRQVWP